MYSRTNAPAEAAAASRTAIRSAALWRAFVIWGSMWLATGAAAPLAQGQPLTGTIDGLVCDESGLRLPGASVTLARADGTIVATTHTDGEGSFAFRGVPPGQAQVTVHLAGFLPVSSTVDVSPALARTLSVILPLAGFADTVTITAARAERTLTSVPTAVAVQSGPLVERARGMNLAEVLRFVPGVVAGDVSGVDDLRLSIRGAGTRAGFGSRGVLLLADGFPVTEPDGQTPHVDGQIDLAAAERVEVVKGPASAVYGGAALGGVVNVISRVPARTPAGALRAEGGSFAFAKAYAAGSSGAGPFVVAGTFGYTHLDGFRDHNSLRNWAGTAKADRATTGSRLRLSLLGTDARLELPGTLGRAQFEQDPSQVRPVYVLNNWGRENRLIRFGGRYERQVGNGGTLELESYGQTRDLFHPIFVVIEQEAERYIGRARYRHTRGSHRLVAGVDDDVQWVDDGWFVNSGGRPGFRLRDDENTVSSIGVYVQDEILVGTRVTATMGLRADRLTYALRDRLTGAATDRRTFRRVSPKGGVAFAARPEVTVYGNVATGFEAPTLGEVRLPSGFDTDVRPQRALSSEVGARGSAGRVSYDAALYRMRVEDEILPQTIGDVTVYRNVARAGHTGLELSARLRTSRWLTVEGTYAYSRFTLDDFGRFSGNQLPGVPPHVGTVRAWLSGVRAWDAAVALVAAGPTFVSDENRERADGYAALSASAGYRVGRLRLFVRGENLGDARYTNRVQVNDASGYYYYPAPGRHASVGVELTW